MKKLLVFAAATMLLASCGLYNKYERPDVNTEGLIRDAVSDVDTLAVSLQDTASFGNLPWRAVFTDPQLQVLIEQGLQKNANLQKATCKDVRVNAEGSQASLPACHLLWHHW